MVVVPNSRMGEAILTNYMQPKPYFRIDLEFILDYNITPNRAIRLLLGAIKSLVDDSRILNDPEPEVRLDEALGHGQKYEVRFFILPTGVSPKESRHIVNRRVLEHLARSGISPAMEKEIVYIEKSSNKNSKVPSSSLDVSGVLYSNSLFSSLQKEDIDHLEGYFVKRECKAGETLFRQGNKGNSMYLLAEGLLYAEIRYEQEVEKTYREQIEPSEHFGEECVLGPNVRSASVTAVTDCLVLELAADQVMEVARKNGTFLSMLNQETSLSKFKTLEGKRKLLQSAQSKFSEVRLKKPLSSSIQTFFTDLFPSAPSPKK
jgi:CRP-like cAMP-binding protein